MKWPWFVAVILLLSVGCGKQQYAQCAAPNDDLKVMFKDKLKAHPFSHSFCIVCNTKIEPSEYADWATEMGAPQGPSDTGSVHPCLYVYGNGEESTDSLSQCKALACGDDASYSDMVGKNNGNFDLGPILNNDSLISEEWIIQDDHNLLSMLSDPTAQSNPTPMRQQ